MAFIDLDRLHLEVGKPALVHKEMQGCNQITQIGIDTDIIMKRRLEVQNVILIRRLVDVLDRHLWVKIL